MRPHHRSVLLLVAVILVVCSGALAYMLVGDWGAGARQADAPQSASPSAGDVQHVQATLEREEKAPFVDPMDLESPSYEISDDMVGEAEEELLKDPDGPLADAEQTASWLDEMVDRPHVLLDHLIAWQDERDLDPIYVELATAILLDDRFGGHIRNAAGNVVLTSRPTALPERFRELLRRSALRKDSQMLDFSLQFLGDVIRTRPEESGGDIRLLADYLSHPEVGLTAAIQLHWLDKDGIGVPVDRLHAAIRAAAVNQNDRLSQETAILLGGDRRAISVSDVRNVLEGDPPRHIHMACLKALGQLGGDPALQALRLHSDHDDEGLRAMAAESLGRLRQEADGPESGSDAVDL